MKKFSSIISKEKQHQSTTTTSSQCRICGDSANGVHYGIVSCESCKTFFRRNAEQKQDELKCRFDGHCEVNIYTRHTCTYCRLRKCFTSGMQIEMIRAIRSKTNKTSQKMTLPVDQVQNSSTISVRSNEVAQLPTLNLLKADQSTLSIKQWILLSNLSHCFDEYSGLELGERYIREQTVLPLKSRFKSTSLLDYFLKLFDGIQLLYKSNQDFLSLSSTDRSILLHSTIQHTSSLAVNFIHYQSGLTNYPAFYHTIEIISHPSIIPATKHMHNRLGFDMITMKLFLAILSFSTTRLTIYSNASATILTNIKEVLRIQNEYIELLWRYLVHKYNFREAVICFSDLIRCIFSIHDVLVKVQDLQWFTQRIDSIVEQTKQTFNLND